jgi:hypothetical protein
VIGRILPTYPLGEIPNEIKVEVFTVIEDIFGMQKVTLERTRGRIFAVLGEYYPVISGYLKSTVEPPTFSATGTPPVYGTLEMFQEDFVSDFNAMTAVYTWAEFHRVPLGSCSVDIVAVMTALGIVAGVVEDPAVNIESHYFTRLEADANLEAEEFYAQMVGWIPVRVQFDIAMDSALTDITQMFGYEGTVSSYIEELIRGDVAVWQYEIPGNIPRSRGLPISGTVTYLYERNAGSKIRLHVMSNEEVVETQLLLSEEEQYNLNNVLEGEYYVVGTPNSSVAKSDVLDELVIDLGDE